MASLSTGFEGLNLGAATLTDRDEPKGEQISQGGQVTEHRDDVDVSGSCLGAIPKQPKKKKSERNRNRNRTGTKIRTQLRNKFLYK